MVERQASWDDMTDEQKLADAIEHCNWLAKEKRHTTEDDPRFSFLLRLGFVRRVPGIMRDPTMFRVELVRP